MHEKELYIWLSIIKPTSQIWEMEAHNHHHHHHVEEEEEEEDGLAVVMRKRVMVVIDDSSPSYSKHAIIWALTHVVNNLDLLILLHVLPQSHHHSNFTNDNYACLQSFCKGCKPQVEVETVVIQGPRLPTVMNQVKKLDVSILILDHTKTPSPFFLWLCGSRRRSDDFVEECIKSVENCLTVGVRKQKRGIGGYLITTKWQTNFWVLA